MINKLKEMKTKYEAENPDKLFIDHLKNILEEIIANFDRKVVDDFFEDMEKVKKQFIELDPQGKVADYLRGMVFHVNFFFLSSFKIFLCFLRF